MAAPTTHRDEKGIAISKGVRQLDLSYRVQVGELSAAHVPSRDAVRFNPKAKLSSFPLNQRASAVTTATFSDSAPIPKISRPVAMTDKCPDMTVIAGPIKQSTPKNISDFRRPIRSMMMPPIKTVKMLGKL